MNVRKTGLQLSNRLASDIGLLNLRYSAVKNNIVFQEKATLYEREVIKKQKSFYSLAEASILLQQREVVRLS
jgi:hypothetical protein